MSAAALGARIVLAAGGTGGHVFPAEALARTLLSRGCELALVTDDRGAAYPGTLGALDTHRIAAAGLAGRGVLGKLRGLARLALGTLQAGRLLRALRPSVVVGFGGYPSVPTVLAAQFKNIGTVLHEQNAVLGRANRLLAPRARRIATSFAHVQHLPPETLDRVVVTGNPVRQAVGALTAQPYPAPNGPLHLLVLGGSQGARVFSDVVPAAIARLPAAARARLRIAQQCRAEDLDRVREAYAALDVDADLAAFLDDVPERLATAHLLIARAGASTVAEATTAGRPALLVPYPHAADDHQSANARALEDCGAAWVMAERDFTPEALAERLAVLLEAPERLAEAARAARAAGLPDAAERLADVVTGLVAERLEAAA